MKKIILLLIFTILLVKPAFADPCYGNVSLAESHVENRNFFYAAKRYEIAARCFEKENDIKKAQMYYSEAGDIRFANVSYVRAYRAYVNASKLADKLNKDEECGDSYFNATKAHLKLNPSSINNTLLMEEYINAYNCYESGREKDKSIILAQKAIESSMKIQYYNQTEVFHDYLINSYLNSRDYEAYCNAMLEKAQFLVDKMKEWESAAIIYREAGECYIGRLDSSEKCEEGLTNAISVIAGRDPEAEAILNSVAGNCYMGSREQLDAYKCFNYVRKAADQYAAMGKLVKGAEQYATSAECFLRVRDISENIQEDKKESYNQCVSSYAALAVNAQKMLKNNLLAAEYADKMKDCMDDRRIDSREYVDVVNDYIYALQNDLGEEKYLIEKLIDSPETSAEALVSNADLIICNYNDLCETEGGETEENCSDCTVQEEQDTTIYFVFILLVIVVLLGIVAYVKMQGDPKKKVKNKEESKKSYEEQLYEEPKLDIKPEDLNISSKKKK